MTDVHLPLPFKLKGSNKSFHTEVVGQLSIMDNPHFIEKGQPILVLGFNVPFDAKYLCKYGDKILVIPTEISRFEKIKRDFLANHEGKYENLSYTEMLEYLDLFG
ncbi:hypothetical protein [Anabaena sp. PCC 7108]|uniref:hypothetical protein n=1 Tax=Anabaena sp. PCC 7108 TaxID=163908 RepID=UPI00034758F7|nr:hypothetical protein [Anabaena sp. PCC 7108]